MLLHTWPFWARPDQLPPEWNWRTWLILCGRGWGKTRTGAEWVYEQVRRGKKWGVLIGATASDVRDVMIEGESGILNIGHPSERPEYYSSKRRLVFPNGAQVMTRSAEKPDSLRGPQGEFAWVDELAMFRYGQMAWDMLTLGMRLSESPQILATTTPRPIPLIKTLLARESTHATYGSTYDNYVNLADVYISEYIKPYEGTRLGEQEIWGKIIDESPGALWKRATLEETRTTETPTLARVVVAVDPATTNTATSDETGIVIGALGIDGHGYILDDYTLKGSPNEWASAAIDAYHDFEADVIVAETNNGGDMVEHTIKETAKTQGKHVTVKQVRASRGKATRAEPISTLYENGKIHHVGMFGKLEDQLCSWVPGDDSPDRLDALVWAMTELMITRKRKLVAEMVPYA